MKGNIEDVCVNEICIQFILLAIFYGLKVTLQLIGNLIKGIEYQKSEHVT